jgi:hypothetical protein
MDCSEKNTKHANALFNTVELLDSLMGCDLVNICAKAERQTSDKSVNEE